MSAWQIWLIIGSLLIVSEIFISGFVVFFFGVGALVTVVATLIFPESSLSSQIAFFTLASLASLLLSGVLFKKTFRGDESSEHSCAEIESDDISGADAVAVSPISPLVKGRVEFRGTEWDATSEVEIASGRVVTIVGRDNLLLSVKPKQI